MTTHIEAMKMALDAIRSTVAYKQGAVMLNEAAEALTEALREAIKAADGYVLVPVEPTPEMMRAFQDRMVREFGIKTTAGYHGRVYAAMLAAAPKGGV